MNTTTEPDTDTDADDTTSRTTLETVDALREHEYLASIRPDAVHDLPGGLEVAFNEETVCSELTHAAGDRQASLDLTSFNDDQRGGSAGRERFIALLERNGLDPVESYARVQAYTDSDRKWRYVWANDDVLLVTGNNPLTGDYSDPDGRMNEAGYTSYMGLEGDEDAVESLLADIRSSATFVKDVDLIGRGYI